MKLNKTLLKLAEKALKDKQTLVPLNKGWQLFHTEYAIGLTQGNKLSLTAKDRQALHTIIKLETGVDLQQIGTKQLTDLPREQVLKYALDEKLAGTKLKQQRLAFKALSDQPLMINQCTYTLPSAGHMDMSLENIVSVEHRCILVVENYRCFDQLHQIKLSLVGPYQQPLVVYRGDEYYSQKTLNLFLQRVQLPVIAMMDIDPAGLLIASSLPYVIGLMCMTEIELDQLLANKGNAELYAKQLPRCRQALNATDKPVLKSLWRLLCKHQKGWVQEHDLVAEYQLQLMLFE